MTDRYLWDSSAQDDSDSTWNSSTVAYLTLTLAIAGMVAGDTLHVAEDHTESLTITTYFTFVEGNYYSENRTTGIYARMEDSTGKIATTSGDDLFIDGHGGVHGLYFETGDSLRIHCDKFSSRGLHLTGCRIDCTSVDTTLDNIQEGLVDFTDCRINFAGGATDQSGIKNEEGGSIVFTRCVITGLDGAGGIVIGISYGSVEFYDCDFPDVDSGSALISGSTSGLYRFSGCSFAVPQSSYYLSDWVYSGRVEAIACTDETSDDITFSQAADDMGSMVTDTGVYIDATLEHSWNLIDNTCQRANPFKSIPIGGYIDSTGSKTFTLEIIQVHASSPPTGLTDQEIGFELLYYGTAANAYRDYAESSAVIGTSPTTHTTSTPSPDWAGAYLSGKSVTKQKITKTVTINRVGYFEARVLLYGPLAASTELFVDEVLDVA